MNIEINKWYLTAGGYLVYTTSFEGRFQRPIRRGVGYALVRISHETSAGLNSIGQDVKKSFNNDKGWLYFTDGSISLNKEWSEKLRIVSEFKYKFPTLPSGYTWAGGYPQFRRPKEGEWFIKYNDSTKKYSRVVKCYGHYAVPYGVEDKRFIVAPVEQQENVEDEHVKPEYSTGEDWVEITCFDHIARKDIDWYSNNTVKWQYVDGVAGNSLKYIKSQVGSSKLRCLRKDLTQTLLSNGKYKMIEDELKPVDTSVSYKYLTPEDEFTIHFTELSEIGKESWRLCQCSGKVSNWRHMYKFRDPIKEEEVQSTHIPFDGPGQYELINGQIVNLNEKAECKESDNIKSSQGNYCRWNWLYDGTIYGPFNNIESLYLKRKIGGIAVTKSDNIVTEKPKEDKIFGTVIANITNSFLTKGKSYFVYEKSSNNSPVFLIKDDTGNKLHYNHCCFDVFVQSGASAPDNTTVGALAPKKEEEVMSVIKAEDVVKVTKATSSFVGRIGLRALNYWVAEPVKEVATKVMRAVRYVTLTAGIMGGIYAYNNPESAKEMIWKCLPKIEIKVEAPKIMG